MQPVASAASAWVATESSGLGAAAQVDIQRVEALRARINTVQECVDRIDVGNPARSHIGEEGAYRLSFRMLCSDFEKAALGMMPEGKIAAFEEGVADMERFFDSLERVVHSDSEG